MEILFYILIIILFILHPSMLSSSPLQKDSSTTQGFEFDKQLGESSFNFVQVLDQYDLEQSCLLRLKAQRQKIEELTRLYQENEKELLSRTEKEREMKEEIEKLSELLQVKQDWQDLKRQYQGMSKKYEAAEDQLNTVKKELQTLTVSFSNQSGQLKQEIKYFKEQKLLSDAHWESIIADKQQELKKQTRSSLQKEYELCEKIQELQQHIETLEQNLSERNSQIESKKSEFQVQLQVREEDLTGFEKIVQSFKKQNHQYKAKIVSLQDSFEKEREEYIQIIEKLKNQVKILKKDQSEKENELYQFKEIVKKCDTKNQNLESTVVSLKTNLKKFKANTDLNLQKITSQNEEEKGKLQMMVDELKCELQRQIEEKSSLAAEIKRLRGHIQRKQQQEKQRRLLLMSEFREIDKMQKIVKKII